MSRVRGGLFAMVAVAVVFLGSACTDYTTGPVGAAGTLRLRLQTPAADDGAVLFEVSGPSIASVTLASGSLELFTRRAAGDTIVGAIVGTVGNGTVAVLRVPAGAAAAAYSARVIEVADRGDGLRASLGGYSLTVEP